MSLNDGPLPKLDPMEVMHIIGLKAGDLAWCIHCDRAVLVSQVLDNPAGDFCTTEGCDGAGWEIDLHRQPFWREASGRAAEP